MIYYKKTTKTEHVVVIVLLHHEEHSTWVSVCVNISIYIYIYLCMCVFVLPAQCVPCPLQSLVPYPSFTASNPSKHLEMGILLESSLPSKYPKST